MSKLLSAASVLVLLTASGAAQAPRVPVVVELFTSEGCSSCPPADALLSKLLKEQPVPGVQIVPLGMHVTYWDQLGWKDPASLQSATGRQQHYGVLWGGDKVYTPQAVIDGREEMVGSDEAAIVAAIQRAARTSHARLTLTAAIDGDQIATTLAMTSPPANVTEPLDVVFFVTEDALTSVVKRGENGGRTLHNDAVVRYERYWDNAPGAEPRRVDIHLSSIRDWKREHLSAVAVLHGRKSERIYGAATAPLK
jgi:hypothetical protein